MKKLILLAGLIIGTMAFAQAPQQMSYQAVIRNASGQLVQNQAVAVRASILKDSPSGTVVYSERLTGTTNANGLLSTAIGSGTVLSGDFTTIDWSSGIYFLKTETDPTGGTSYSITGTSQLLSVPYAMLAKKVTFPMSENINSSYSLMNIENSGLGSALELSISNSSNGARVLSIYSNGTGPGVFSTSDGGYGVWGVTNTITGVGVMGDNTNGEAIVGRSQGGTGVGAVVGRNDGGGYGVRGFVTTNSSNTAIGVLGQVGHSGSTGKAARFENINSSNYINVFEVESNSTSNLAVFKKSGSNVARINAVGKGFFNGGTQNSGADIAEAFDVEGNPEHYEPGDILVISTKTDRSVEKSSEPYSTLVAGVYATKPGVLLTEENIDSDLEGKVPMGVIGVIPTKVCLEGGTIKRGDLLVTSSISGVAMKADPDKVKVGQVLGKALQDFNGNGIGKINVLVSVK